MKITAKENTTALRGLSMIKLALLTAICGLGLMSNAVGDTLYLDFGTTTTTVPAPAGFTKVLTPQQAVGNYTFANVAGSAYTLTVTNIGSWNGGNASSTCDKDGFYTGGSPNQAGFQLSGLPAGVTVTVYACMGWDGSGSAAKIVYGGQTNQVIVQSVANPSMTTLQNVGRAVPDVNGNINGTWTGPGTGQGQIGAMIFDIEPCQPVITVNGNNPLLVPVNSTFHDPGATAVESCSGSALTVTTNGTVDATTIGTYTLTYTAIADGYTNTATRTVNVVLSDFLNLDLANTATDGGITPAGFNRLNRSGANMTFSVPSVGGTTYTVGFTNVNGSYGGTGTIDKDGFYCSSGATNGFYVSGLVPGSQVTLYACWAWDGANNAAIIYYGGASNLLNVGSGITLPSPTTFMNCGIAVADGTGIVRGTWTGKTGHQGQIGGMIFGIQAPVGHTITILPAGVTNSCGGSATFTAAAPGGATYQWFNNLSQAIIGATNTTLVLTNLHPSASGNYTFTATATNSLWTSSTSCVVSIYDIAPPVMTMNGSNLTIVWLNSTWTDPGVSAWDSCPGNSLAVTTNGTVNTSVVGEYDLTYSATAGNGVQSSLARAVIVIDNTIVPDVQLALDYQSTSDSFPPPTGFTRIAPFDLSTPSSGDVSIPDPTSIGSSYVLSLTNVSCWNQGTYLAYQTISTDGILNYALNPATFTLSGLPPGVVVNLYAVYGWGGAAHAAKIVYGGATNQLTVGITTNSPNPPTQADFQFVGSAVATNGVVTGTWYGPTGPASEGQIGGMIINVQSIPAHSVAITSATSAPVCGTNVTLTATVSGIAPFTYQWYDNHTNLIAGETNASYMLVNVHPANEGNYTLIAHNAFGSATNIATIAGVTDSAAPVMALNGINPVVIVVNNGPYVDAGATAYDLCAQGSLPVQSNNPVNVTAVGTYTVTYSATTGSATPGSITRTVNVVPVPNDTLQWDFAPTGGTIQPAPAGFTKVQNGPGLTVGNYSFPGVAGSSYTLSITNIGSYNSGNTNEPLVTDGFYSSSANGPAYFTLSELPQGMKVTLYAIYAWDGVGKYANVFFGATNAQIVYNGDPGTNPALTNFTRIGAAIVGSSGAVNGHWQGPGGPNTEGQVGAMVIFVGTNTPPVASDIAMSATHGHPDTLKIIGGVSAPSDPDGDPLTITAVQSPTPHSGTVTTDGINVTYTSLNAFTGTDTFTYTVGDGFGGFATATVTVAVTNNPPVASSILMGAASGHPATLKIIGGTSAPTDPDDDPLTVTAVQSPTPHSGTVTTDGINVTYTSSNGFTGQDTFIYTVGDGFGGFVTATVTVDVAAGGTGFNRVSGPVLVNGLYQLGYQGIPHLNYALETTASLAAPVTWNPVVTNQASASGALTFTITPSQGMGFFRTRYVP